MYILLFIHAWPLLVMRTAKRNGEPKIKHIYIDIHIVVHLHLHIYKNT